MKQDLRAGLKGTKTISVTQKMTVPSLGEAFSAFEDMPPVFATAYMVAFIEWTCTELVQPLLDENQRTVGTHVNVSHLAATPANISATAEVELVEVEGRKLRFKVACRDAGELIGEGFHERFIIDYGKFMAKVAEKERKFAPV